MVSIVRGLRLGVSLTRAAYRATPARSVRTGLGAHAGSPVVRDDDLADPAREPPVRGHDEGPHVAFVDLVEPVADHPRGDERAALAIPRAWRDWSRTSCTAPASQGAAASGTAATATTAREPRSMPALCAARATAAPAAANTASAVSMRPTSSAEIWPR